MRGMTLFALMTLALVAAGCSDAASDDGPKVPEVKAENALTLVAPGGSSFSIQPTTRFCVKPSRYDKALVSKTSDLTMLMVQSLNSTIERRGQSVWMSPGEGRVWFGDDLNIRCPNDGVNILIDQRIGMNGSGTPYRITVTVWQRDVARALYVERPNGISPESALPGPMSFGDAVSQHIANDARMLAHRYIIPIIFQEKQP